MMHMSAILEVLGQGASVCPNGLCFNLIQFACSTVQNANGVETRATQHKLWFSHLFKPCFFLAVDKNTLQTSLTTPARVQDICALQYVFCCSRKLECHFLHPFSFSFYFAKPQKCVFSHINIL